MAEQAQSLRLQAPVDPDEPQRSGPHCRLQTGHQTGRISESCLSERDLSSFSLFNVCVFHPNACCSEKCYSEPVRSALGELLLQLEYEFLKPDMLAFYNNR